MVARISNPMANTATDNSALDHASGEYTQPTQSAR